MPKSIKLKNDTYLDSSSIVHNRELLSDVLNKEIYSEEEIIIGYAIKNNKKVPVYRKTITTGSFSSSSANPSFIIDVIKNVEHIFRFDAFMEGDRFITLLPYVSYSNNNIIATNFQGYSFALNKTTGQLALAIQRTLTPTVINSVHAVIEYTKTTD